MTARAELPFDPSAKAPAPAAKIVALPRASRRQLAEGTLVPLAEGVAGLFFDTADAGRGRLTATVDGIDLPPPFIATRLPLRRGGERHLVITGQGAGALLGRHLVLRVAGEAAAVIDPSWLQSPLGDAAGLLEGITDDGRRRLLKLFLTTGQSLFGAGAVAPFGAAAAALLELLGVPQLAPAGAAALGAGCVLSYAVSQRVDAARISEVVLVDAGRSRRLPDCRPILEPRRRGHLLHLHLPRPVGPGAALVCLGPDQPMHLRLPAGEAPLRPLPAWLERREPAARAWALGLLEAIAPADAGAAALVRELRHAASAAPALTVAHLTATPRGLLYALRLKDDEGLVREIVLERGRAVLGLSPLAGTMRGYAPLAAASAIADGFRLRLVYHSGRAVTVSEGRLEAFRGGLPAPFRAEDAPLLAAALLDAERPDPARLRRRMRDEAWGPAVPDPVLRLLVPAGETPDALRARAALLDGERHARRVEVVVHGSEAEAEGLQDLLAEIAEVFALRHRLVMAPGGARDVDALRLALGVAAAAPALVLGRDVLPEAPGWLAAWLRRLGAPWSVLGGTLLDPHGAVIHAGGALVRLEGGPVRRVQPHRGLPASELPGAATRPGTLASADCVGLDPSAIGRLLAADPAAPTPDVLLALGMRAAAEAGARVGTFLRGRFVRYGAREPEATTGTTAAAVEAAALGRLLDRATPAAGPRP